MNRLSPRDQLLHFVRERDVACPLCGYNVRGLSEPRCPECGKPLTLTVRLVERFMTAWIVFVVCLCASAGLGIVLAAVCVFHHLPGFPGSFVNAVFVTAALCYFIAAIPLSFWALYIRRRFLKWHRSVQWLLAVIACVISAISFALICTTIL